jgi:hypothetical protein
MAALAEAEGLQSGEDELPFIATAGQRGGRNCPAHAGPFCNRRATTASAATPQQRAD